MFLLERTSLCEVFAEVWNVIVTLVQFRTFQFCSEFVLIHNDHNGHLAADARSVRSPSRCDSKIGLAILAMSFPA